MKPRQDFDHLLLTVMVGLAVSRSLLPPSWLSLLHALRAYVALLGQGLMGRQVGSHRGCSLTCS